MGKKTHLRHKEKKQKYVLTHLQDKALREKSGLSCSVIDTVRSIAVHIHISCPGQGSLIVSMPGTVLNDAKADMIHQSTRKRQF